MNDIAKTWTAVFLERVLNCRQTPPENVRGTFLVVQDQQRYGLFVGNSIRVNMTGEGTQDPSSIEVSTKDGKPLARCSGPDAAAAENFIRWILQTDRPKSLLDFRAGL